MIGCVEEYFDNEIEGFLYRWFPPVPFDDLAISAEENGDIQWRIIDSEFVDDRRSTWCPWGRDEDGWPNWRLSTEKIYLSDVEMRWLSV